MKLFKDGIILDKAVTVKLILPLVLSVFGVFLSVLVPMNFKKIIDSISKNNEIEYITVFTILVLIVLQLLFQVISDYILQKIGILEVSNLRKKLISKILFLNKSYFDKSLSGDTSSILINDASAISYLLSTTIPTLVNSLISIVVITIMLFYLSINLSVLIIFLVPLLFLIYFPLGKLLSKTSLENQKKLGVFNHYSYFITNENLFIKTSATEQIEYLKGKDIISELNNIGFKQAKAFAIIGPLFMTVTIFGALSIITYGLYLVKNNIFTMGSFVAYVTLFIQMLNPLGTLGNSFSHIKGITGAVNRIREILTVSSEDVNSGIKELKFSKLVFKNVNFSYEGDNNDILSNFNFSFEIGRNIAIVGPSGSGKTTIFSLIEKLYKVNSGSIFIDNYNLSTVSSDYFRSNVGYVSQRYPVILGTVKDNLLYGIRNKKISDVELIEYTKLTNFFEVIDSLPDGLDTFIGDKGVLLSEGQKQRLAITKVLLQNPRILLMDEVTSSLDSYSETVIQNTIEKFGKDKIIITIAHRLSTVKKADCIIFLENGCITGTGTHRELYKNHELYRSFVESQFMEEL